MAEVELTLPGGLYHNAISLDWLLSDDVDRFSYTVNGAQPTMSKYIAYDTLNPPNPFLAITQDGRGNVIYDGGFPKFYNQYSAGVVGATTFAQLTPALKYLHNAFKLCLNPAKLAIGNRDILVLGDAAVSDNSGYYSVRNTAAQGFLTTLQIVGRVGGWNMIVKDRANYTGGILNPTFAELDKYAAVMLMSSLYSNTEYITNAAVTDLVSYREAGNGLVFITDHGTYKNTSLEQSDQPGRSEGFYRMANKVIRNFGSYFTDNFDRVPVNVGFLRRTYGDSPLYDGMANTDSIAAGGSESRITVATYPEYTKETAPTLHFDADGKYVVSVLAIMKDGSTRTFRYLYNVVIGEFIWWRDAAMNNLGPVRKMVQPQSDFLPYIESAGLGTLKGSILRNGKKIASFTRDDVTGTLWNWFAGSNIFPVADDDVFTIDVVTPFSYKKTITVERYQPPIADSIDFAETTSLLARDDYVNTDRGDVINSVMRDLKQFFPVEKPTTIGETARNLSFIRQATAGYVGLDTVAYIYPTTALTDAAKATLTTTPHCIIDAQRNEVFEYIYPSWVIVPGLKAQDILGAPRLVTGITNSIKFRLAVTGAINRVP